MAQERHSDQFRLPILPAASNRAVFALTKKGCPISIMYFKMCAECSVFVFQETLKRRKRKLLTSSQSGDRR